MNMRKLTSRVLLSAFALLVVYEIVVLIWGTHDSLISPTIRDGLAHYNSICLIFGVLVGHFTFVRRPWMPWPEAPGWCLAVLFALLGIAGALDWFTTLRVPPEYAVPVYATLGHFLWGQKEGPPLNPGAPKN